MDIMTTWEKGFLVARIFFKLSSLETWEQTSPQSEVKYMGNVH